MKKKKKRAPESETFLHRLARTAKIVLGVIVGGVVATTAIAVFARGTVFLERISYPVYEDVTVKFVTPESGAIVGSSVPVKIYAAGYRGMSRVEVYVRSGFSPERLATLTGAGPYYTTNIDLSEFDDHSYETLFAVAYTPTGKTVTSEFVHLQIEKCTEGIACAKVYADASDEQMLSQDFTGLTVGEIYTIFYQSKRATEKRLRLVITDSDTGETLTTCETHSEEFSWHPGNECTFRATSSEARIIVTVGEKGETFDPTTYMYIDAFSISDPDGNELLANASFSELNSGWEGTAFTRVGITPVGAAKPFAPSKIFSVTSNIEPSETQNIGFWFFKGWPWAHYSWWSRLGSYERQSIFINPTSSYSWQPESVDSMKWISPLTIWVTRETSNQEEFNFTDTVLSVQTDLGSLDICLPDIDWSSPLVNGLHVTGLSVDEFGNTYYSGRYADPDALRSENMAQQCTCSDGTAINTCTDDRTTYCTNEAELIAADCRTCGCATPRSTCQESDSGAWSCVTDFDRAEIDL